MICVETACFHVIYFQNIVFNENNSQISNISRALAGNIFVDHSAVAGASRRRCSNYSFILDLAPGFNWLGKYNCNARRETVKFWYLVRLILESLRYIES